jgi:hypothetical protein
VYKRELKKKMLEQGAKMRSWSRGGLEGQQWACR